MVEASTRRRIAALGASLAAALAGPAAAAALPTGAWTCAQAPGSTGVPADQSKGSEAGRAIIEQLWILDGQRYALSSNDRRDYDASAEGRYTVQGDVLTGLSGPLDQSQTSVRVAAGSPPSLTMTWSSAPGLIMTCRPAS